MATEKRDKLLTRPVKRRMAVKFGPVDMGVEVDPSTAENLKNSMPYRYLIKPTLRTISGSGNGNGNGRKHSTTVSGDYRAGFVAAQDTPVQAPDSPEAKAILEKISGYEWYHTIELGHGVATPGYVDHRRQLPYYNLPKDMTGMRVLDVATFDGFWAFEFERRGAEVVAIDVGSLRQTDIPKNWVDVVEKKMDLDEPKGRGFQIAHEILGSKVKKEVCSVYEISPERLGRFDMAFCSDLLIHIREPLAAMEAIWTVTDKFAVFADVYHPDLEAFDNALVEFCQAGQADLWWRPSVRAYKLWLQVARFSRVEEVSRFVLEAKYRSEIPKVVLHAYR